MTSVRRRSPGDTPSRREPTAAPAAAAGPARRAPRARARPRATPCEPPATPAPSRPSYGLLRIDLVLVRTLRGRKTNRQPERLKEIRPVPVDDLDDASLLHAHNGERERPIAGLPRCSQVDGERGLQVCGGGDEEVLARSGVPLAAASERVEAVVPERAWREGEARVRSHERGEGHEVTVLESLDVAPRDLALLSGRSLPARPLEP